MNQEVRVMTKFVQITANRQGLFALDTEGSVWFYHPATGAGRYVRYAHWTRLTSYGTDATRRRHTHPPEMLINDETHDPETTA